MSSLEDALIAFFEQVARREPEHLRLLQQETSFVLRPECWCFTLPDLYRFLQRQDPTLREFDYRRFRRVLMNSPVNHRIQHLGAVIDIADNRGHIDRSTYALVWQRHTP